MTAVVLSHSRLSQQLVVPGLLMVLLLVAVGIVGMLSPWVFDPTSRRPLMLPVAVQIAIGALMAGFFSRYLWIAWHARHGYFERLTISNDGIAVESASGPAAFVPWTDVLKVDNPLPFLVRVFASSRVRPICVLNNGWRGSSRDFLVAKEMIQRHASGTA